jgi:molybdopterin molybdotransferase
MPEFLQLLPPDAARALLLSQLGRSSLRSETVGTLQALDRVIAQDLVSSQALPDFRRTTVDGYVVQARNTFGASDTQPAYLTLIGEIQMGEVPSFSLLSGQCALIHTGGMLPAGADAVVMLEHSQTLQPPASQSRSPEIEIMRAVAEGENVILIGEDVAEGETVIPRGTRLRPAEIGGLMALGITELQVVIRPKIGVISSGDEVVPPTQATRPGQVRDVNAYSISAMSQVAGGDPVLYGIVPDNFGELLKIGERALSECDVLVITAGSSASARDMTARMIGSLGTPGVLVHGINTRPGKPTILGICDGKAVIGLPGNPVSALVNSYLFLAPVIQQLLGENPRPRPAVMARLSVNLASQAGREDWIPVRLSRSTNRDYEAKPIFGKSNLIFTLAAGDGLLRIPPDATGMSAGEIVEVILI